MKIRKFRTEELATVYVAAVVESLLNHKSDPVLGLATGSTPIKLYRQLVDFYHQGLSFSHATTINLDEYVGLGPDHPESYRYFMERHLFQHIDVPRDHIFIPDGQAKDLKEECARYDTVLEEHPIDLQILGIGHNGHIGFNEPDLSLKTRTHVIALTDDTIRANARFFVAERDVPTHAITMGIQSILQARSIILMAFGEDKADIVRQALSGEVSTTVPASFLQMHQDVRFVLDDAASRDLDDYVENPLYAEP